MVALALLAVAASPFEFKLTPQTGLTVLAKGLPLVQGSGCQIYAPGWTRGYYATFYADQKIEHPDDDTAILTFANGPATGKFIYHREGSTLHVDQTYKWDGDEPALVEVTAAKFWAPALVSTVLNADGKPVNLPRTPDPKADMLARRLAPDGATLSFAAPWGAMTVKPREMAGFLFDARGFPQEYAVGRSLYWYGVLAQPLPKGQAIHIGFDITFDMRGVAAPSASLTRDYTVASLPEAEQAMDDKLPLAPYPKRMDLTSDKLELGGTYTFPAGRMGHFDDFTSGLTRRFEMPSKPDGHPTLAADGGIHDMKLPHEAYRLEIRPDGFTVFGQDEAGYRHGLRRLAMLAYSSGGKVFLPIGTLADWPSTPWRGVHLFVGPKAEPLQRELMDKVLLPFGFNKAILECERTAWATLPNVRGPDVMTTDALHELFRLYRKEGLDPIPLVQSFGHMEWFFAHGGNLDVAFNPATPYGVDPRKPQTKVLLDQLWNEVFDVTEATTVHFGCDEVDMTGWTPNPGLMTNLWQLQMPILGDIAKAHNATMMLWGDMALAPSEAIDATNGFDSTQAAARRAAIPEGAMIADWHYKADRKFEEFFPSLKLWKDSGHTPIAAYWHEPDNVYGFSVAGVQQGGGVLKTTWSSSSSSAEDPIVHFDEYAAMVLTGEYAWSGRQDPPTDIGYDYRDLFRRLYFERPMPLQSHPGSSLASGPGQELQIGRYHFASFEPVSLFSDIVGVSEPKVVLLKGSMSASTLVLACGCQIASTAGDPVATVTVSLEDGSTVSRVLKYDEDLRGESDPGVVPLAENANWRYATMITLPKPHSSVVSVRVTAANSYSRLTVYGLTGM